MAERKPHPNPPGGPGDGTPHGQMLPPHKPPTKPGHHGGGGGGMSQDERSAFDYFMSLLESYGLSGFGEIAKVVRKAIIDGITDPSQLDLLVRDTDAWRTRFAGNEELKNNGGNVLSVAEYLSVENSMRQVMAQAGLPQGFYDDPSDFSKFIGGSVSAAELQGRVTDAVDLMNRHDSAIADQLTSMGLSKGDLLAYYLDPKRALPILQTKYQTTLIGAAARRAGVTADNEYAQHLAELGVSEDQAVQGYGQVAQITPDLQSLGDIYGEDYQQSDAEKEIFEGGSGATRRRLSSRERGSFSGSSGTGQSSLGKPSTGSY